ncbi:unnamed protein product [Durusdinium trenchii]|uniref:START domain-containing protein n=1 Tax=Durusdinium trenchii TaxID=1381693 RepID=A0ABP0RR14_9DINO
MVEKDHIFQVHVLACCITLALLVWRSCSRARRHSRSAASRGAPVPLASRGLAQDLAREALNREREQRSAVALQPQYPRHELLQRLWRGVAPTVPKGGQSLLPLEAPEQSGPSTWWPELEHLFRGDAKSAEDAAVPIGADAQACQDPSRHQGFDGMSIRCVLQKPPNLVWFADTTGNPLPVVISETVIQTPNELPIDAVVWAMYSPTERLQWDKSPWVAHEILYSGGVMDSGAVRDILYSRVSIAPGISDRDLIQERFLMKLPEEQGDGYAILMCSCSDELAATLGRPADTSSSTVVRSKDLLSAYILRPREARGSFCLQTLSQKDVGSHVPSFLQHMARSVGKRKPLEMAMQLQSHCEQRQGYGAGVKKATTAAAATPYQRTWGINVEMQTARG